MLLLFIAAAVSVQAEPSRQAVPEGYMEAALVNVAYQTALCQPHLSDWLGADDMEDTIRRELGDATDQESQALLRAAVSAAQRGKQDRATVAVDEDQCSERVKSAFAYFALPLRVEEPTIMFRLDPRDE